MRFFLFLHFLQLLSLYVYPSQQQQECSSTLECKRGCCSSAGHCGYGPDYCGDGCQGTCDRKSECNPSWDSDEFSEKTKCPLNVCCSKHGFCGTTSDFCGDESVYRPQCSVAETPVNRVIGYYEAWSKTERDCMGMDPEDIPFGVYTHLIFSFATIDLQTFEIIPGNADTERLMHRIGTIRLMQPDIQIWVAVGGWTFNDPWMPTAKVFSDLAASEEKQNRFFDSLIKMMNTFGFDGVDVDWEYPVAEDRAGRPEDFENFVTFMDRLNKMCKSNGRKKGTSLTLPSSYWYLQHFDIIKLQDTVDWFNLMSYDIHGSWDIDNEHTGPFANAHTNLTEIQTALDLLWRNDIDPKKVVLGVAFYSRSVTLTDPGCSEPGCIVASGGNAGRCSGQTGVLLNAEIDEIIKDRGLQPVMHRAQAVKTVSWDNQWASFDDEATWRIKSNIARSQCISGVMVWAVSQDDTSGTYAHALTRALGRKVMDPPEFVPKEPSTELPSTVETCRWTNCHDDCPEGWKHVPRDGSSSNEIMLNQQTCYGTIGGHQTLCCPGNYELPKCTWRGHRDSGYCSPGCEDGETEVSSLNAHCYTAHQKACCTVNAATLAYSECKWVGESPNCAGSGQQAACPSDFPLRLVASSNGAGGEQRCAKGAKSYCCRGPEAPPAFRNCKWYTDATNYVDIENFPEPSCPVGQIKIAMSQIKVEGVAGWQAYCCEGTPPPSLPPRDDGFGSIQLSAFKESLDKYLEDPTCPADSLQPPIGDLSDLGKRDAGKCPETDWYRLTSWVYLLITSSQNLEFFCEYFNQAFAAAFGTGLTCGDLREFTNRNAWMDPMSFAERTLLNPYGAMQGMERMDLFGSQLCVNPADSAKRTVSPLTDRNIAAFEPENTDIPEWRFILQGIRDNNLSLHYARWESDRRGPFMELAYWIGRTPGAEPDIRSEEYLRYTDRRAAHAIDGFRDRWVVMLLHFEQAAPGGGLFLTDEHGNTFIGASAVTIFHAQLRTNGTGRYFRAIGHEGMQTREEYHCGGEGSRWYLGRPVPFLDSRDVWVREIQPWAENLYRLGYFGQAGIQQITSGYGTPLAYLLSRSESSAYNINFLIDPETGYAHFNINAPPPDQTPR